MFFELVLNFNVWYSSPHLLEAENCFVFQMYETMFERLEKTCHRRSPRIASTSNRNETTATAGPSRDAENARKTSKEKMTTTIVHVNSDVEPNSR